MLGEPLQLSGKESKIELKGPMFAPQLGQNIKSFTLSWIAKAFNNKKSFKTELSRTAVKYVQVSKQSFICVTDTPPKVFVYSKAGNTKGGSIIVPLTSCLTGLE